MSDTVTTPFSNTGDDSSNAPRSAPTGTRSTPRASAVEEVRRLLYVSLTRARDCLVIALPAKRPKGEWLESLEADWLLPDGAALTLPNGQSIPIAFAEIIAADDWAAKPALYEARWVKPREAASDLVRHNLNPSTAEPAGDIRAGEIVELGRRVSLDGVKDVTALGQAVHAIIAAEIAAVDSHSQQRAERILREWGFANVSAVEVLGAVTRFTSWVTESFRPKAWHVEYPIRQVLPSGQVVQGFIDLLIETDNGWVIVDHKATPRPRTQWQALAQGYSGQLAMYKSAVEQISGQPVLSMWIHLPVGGGVIPLEPRTR